MSRNVCEVILDVLADAGVKHIFAIPGGAINAMVEAIRKQDKIQLIHVRHEESGAFAASAIAKLTGELAVCMGTSGPGAIHLLNGLYDARFDHAPVLAICGQQETEHQGVEYMQDVHLDRLFSDVCVYNEEINNPAQVPRVVEEACRAAINYKGVANLILPADIGPKDVPNPGRRSKFFKNESKHVAPDYQLVAAAKLLQASPKIAILAGIGARDASEELLEFARLLKAPIIKALRGKGVIPDMHPYCLGGTGLLGTTPAIKAIEGCGLFVMVGTDFPYYDFYPQDTPAIQIDIDAKQIGKRIPVEIGLVGEAKGILAALNEHLASREDDSFLKEMQDRMQEWWADLAKDENSKDIPMHPQALGAAISRAASEDAIFCCDTGNVTFWTAHHVKMRDKQLFTVSGGMASMAFGLPAAIGAQLRFPGRQVWAICGDGGFTMLMGDFVTACQYELPIIVVVFNNGKLGMIQMEQEASGYPEYGIHMKNPDFVMFSRACGGEGEAVRDPNELDAALDRAIRSGKPYILDVFINPGELTMPPKVELAEAFGYAKAKIKEFMGKGDKTERKEI